MMYVVHQDVKQKLWNSINLNKTVAIFEDFG